MKKYLIIWVAVVVWIVSYWIKNWLFTKEDVINKWTEVTKIAIDKTKDKLENLSEEDIKKWVEKTYDTVEKVVNEWSKYIQTTKWEWNTYNDSFSKAKSTLLKEVYWNKWKTLYCWCDFTNKDINLNSCWYKSVSDWMKDRASKIEFEHVVPAENFWKAFKEWREWDEQCVDSKWKSFKWRNCAEKVNEEYRYMQSDMYNLYPAVWEVNWLRSNLDHWMIAWNDYQTFWKCEFKYSKSEKKTEPRDSEKWIVARTYLYMDASYDKYSLSSQNKKLYEAWDKQFPVTKDECTRYQKIKSIQWNENVILKDRCEKAWY